MKVKYIRKYLSCIQYLQVHVSLLKVCLMFILVLPDFLVDYFGGIIVWNQDEWQMNVCMLKSGAYDTNELKNKEFFYYSIFFYQSEENSLLNLFKRILFEFGP